jgi:Zn-dependent M16 (insulinase) family peptidase
MTSSAPCPAATLKVGEKLHGFRIIRIEQILEIRITAYIIEHEKTGAKVIHLHCDDP